MRINRLKHTMIAAPALVLAAACARTEEPKLDEALRNDLALASQAQAYQPQQFVSPMEQGMAYGQQQPMNAGYAPGPYYAPAPRAAAPRPVYRTASASRSSGRSSGTVYREPARQPSRPMVRHKARDAAIGAAAGAAIGVATSARKDRLKGGLIGAVAGGTIGAIIGNNVDVQRPKP
jgi:hypothetical protein